MSEMLKHSQTSPPLVDLLNCLKRSGQLLRVLAHVAESIHEEASLLPQLESVVQNEFINVLCTQFEALENALNIDGEGEAFHVSEGLIFLARLLQFNLGFPGAWTNQVKEVSSKLLATLFRLAVVSRFVPTPLYFLTVNRTDLRIRRTNRSRSIPTDC